MRLSSLLVILGPIGHHPETPLHESAIMEYRRSGWTTASPLREEQYLSSSRAEARLLEFTACFGGRK